MGKEACLLFSTGYQTAQGVIPTLVNRGDYVISDKDNHACIVAGNLMAKGAFGDVARYKHNDMADLERQLARLPENAGKLIVTDGVFSTSGEIVDLPTYGRACQKYGARIMVDDAHALGVIGKGGRGTASYFGLDDETDLTMGTFSKSLASLGGWVVGEERVINYIKHTSPALIFSASPTPASVAARSDGARIMRAEPERIDHLIANADYMRRGLQAKRLHDHRVEDRRHSGHHRRRYAHVHLLATPVRCRRLRQCVHLPRRHAGLSDDAHVGDGHAREASP